VWAGWSTSATEQCSYWAGIRHSWTAACPYHERTVETWNRAKEWSERACENDCRVNTNFTWLTPDLCQGSSLLHGPQSCCEIRSELLGSGVAPAERWRSSAPGVLQTPVPPRSSLHHYLQSLQSLAGALHRWCTCCLASGNEKSILGETVGGRQYLTICFIEKQLPVQLDRWGWALISAASDGNSTGQLWAATPLSCPQSSSSILSGAPCLYASAGTGSSAPDLAEWSWEWLIRAISVSFALEHIV